MSWLLVLPTDNISPGVFLVFWGLRRGDERRVLFLAQRPARECLHPAALVLWHPSSTPKPGQLGLESRPGAAGEVEAFGAPVGLCWARPCCQPGSSPVCI